MAGREVVVERSGKAIFIRPGPNTALEDLDLPLAVELMLENIRREWAGAGRLDEMLSYVYSTAPMVEATARHQPHEKSRLNLIREQERLEEMIKAALL